MNAAWWATNRLASDCQLLALEVLQEEQMRSAARLATFVIALAAHASALAQSNTSTVIGTLRDEQGNQVNAQFVQVTATASPRVIQLALRAML